MPEIKNTFQAGKMNKDVDERLVQNGEYRDAMNIQVRTTDGDAIGTAQNILGNESVGLSYYADWMGSYSSPSVSVASVPDEKNNKVYFFFASPPLPYPMSTIKEERIYIDSIIEQDSNGNSSPVFIDRWCVIDIVSMKDSDGTNTIKPETGWSYNGPFGPPLYSVPYTSFLVKDGSKYRAGMTIKAIDSTTGEDLFTALGGPSAKIKAINANEIILYDQLEVDLDFNGYLVFEHERVLNFTGGWTTNEK
jgi:hypothetical protein